MGKEHTFDYERVCMGVRSEKPKSYKISFSEDYRMFALTKVLPLKKIRLLDIGCGGGMIAESLPYYFPKSTVHGCDVSKAAIRYARKFGSGKVTYGMIKNKRFPYKNEYFDICICLDVLEHVPDVSYFLKEVKRVLKKNGQFFLIVPCEGEYFTMTWLFQKLNWGEKLTYKYFGHIHPEFTHDSIIELVQKHNFIVERKNYSEHGFYQILLYVTYFFPKILLECIFGEKVMNQYSDSEIVRRPPKKRGPLLLVRNLWFIFMRLMRYPMYWETLLFRDVPIGAWKIHVLMRKK